MLPCSPDMADQGHITFCLKVLTALRASRRACCSACSRWSLLMNSSRAAALAAGSPEVCSQCWGYVEPPQDMISHS